MYYVLQASRSTLYTRSSSICVVIQRFISLLKAMNTVATSLFECADHIGHGLAADLETVKQTPGLDSDGTHLKGKHARVAHAAFLDTTLLPLHAKSRITHIITDSGGCTLTEKKHKKSGYTDTDGNDRSYKTWNYNTDGWEFDIQEDERTGLMRTKHWHDHGEGLRELLAMWGELFEVRATSLVYVEKERKTFNIGMV